MEKNQSEPQADPDINNQSVPSHEQTPLRKKRNLIWLWIMLGLICVAGIAAALFFAVLAPQSAASQSGVPRDVASQSAASQSAAPQSAAPKSAAPQGEVAPMPPLLLLNGSEVIMVRGGDTTSLGAACIKSNGVTSFNGVCPYNAGVMFYLCDVDKNTGEGTLMKAATTGNSPPVEMAKGVCMASISGDGSRVLYITNMDITGGDLMLIEGEQAKLVAGDVVPEDIEISQSGEYFSFLQVNKTSKGYKYTVCTGRSAEDIKVTDEFKTDKYGSGQYTSDVLDNGALVYTLSTYGECEVSSELYICEYGGEPKKLADKGFTVGVDCSAYFYSVDDTLYYVDENGEQERIIDGFDGFGRIQIGNTRVMDDRLMLLQKGESEGTVNVYTLIPGQEAEKVCTADDYYVKPSRNNNCIAYELDGRLFVCIRDKDGWSEGISMDAANPYIFEFDYSERYLYYSDKKNKADIKGDLYRYDTATGDKKKMQSGITHFYPAGDAVYTRNETDGTAYYIVPDGKETLIANGADSLAVRNEGTYIMQKNGETSSLLFMPPGGGDAEVVVSKFDDSLFPRWDIEYQMTLPKDVKQTLDEMYEDILILLDKYNGTHLAKTDKQHRTWEENMALSDKLSVRPDVPKDIRHIFGQIYAGFIDFRHVPKNPDAVYNADKDEILKYALEFFSNAVSAYEAYFAE